MNDELKNFTEKTPGFPDECETCVAPLPKFGYFCGKCLTQFKCKSCGAILKKDFSGCVMCGTPRYSNNVSQNVNTPTSNNTFRVHETKNERTIEASFSDVVGKDVALILRDAARDGRVNAVLGASKTNGPKDIDLMTEEVEATVLDRMEKENIPSIQKQVESIPSEYPTLRAIAMKKLAGSEPEWIVVYAFYASNFGKDTFTREQIVEKYKESGRAADYESRRLAQNITRTVQSGYLNPLSDEFSILDIGIKKAIEIVTRTASATPRSKNAGKKTSKDESREATSAAGKKNLTKSKGLKKLNNIDFEPEGKESLRAFYEKYSLKNDQERNLLFVHYLRQTLGIAQVTFDHIYTCYDILDLKVSENLPQTVRNTASRTGWIEVEDSIILITIRGGNQIKEWNKQLNK